MQDKELRDIRDRVQDKEGELDTLRKAGKNLRERLDEKEVETRGVMDRVSSRHTRHGIRFTPMRGALAGDAHVGFRKSGHYSVNDYSTIPIV